MSDINIADKLSKCRSGFLLYSPLCGDCFLDVIIGGIINVRSKYNRDFQIAFYSDGKYTKSGEVLLFPSKDSRDWSKFNVFDFKPGDLVDFGIGYSILDNVDHTRSHSTFKLLKQDLSIIIGDINFPNEELKLVNDGYIKSQVLNGLKKNNFNLDSNFKIYENDKTNNNRKS